MNNKKQIDEYLKTRTLMPDETETGVRMRLADFCEFLKRRSTTMKMSEKYEDEIDGFMAWLAEGFGTPVVLTVENVGMLEAFVEYLNEKQAEKTCEWKEDEDGAWDTGCKNTAILIEGTPKENEMHFCWYCGGRIIEKQAETEQEDDD